MKKISISIAALGLLAGAVNAQQPFHVIPGNPVSGQMTTIAYNPATTSLKGLAPVKGVVWAYRNNDWEAYDLPMKMVDTGWVGSFRLPVNAAIIVATFSANGKVDRGGKMTYTMMTHDTAGREIATNYAAWAFLRTNALKDVVPPIVDDTARITDDIGLFWMNTELKYHPESRRRIFYNAMTILQHEDPKRADTIIPREIAFISSLPDPSEKELMDVSKAYRYLLAKPALADSMNKVIISRFPDGITARDQSIRRMFTAKPDERVTLWNEFVKKFPPEKFKNVTTETSQLYLEKTFRGMVYTVFLKEKKLSAIDPFLDQASLVSLTEFHRQLIVNALEHGEQQPAAALPYSTKLVERIAAYADRHDDAESRYYSPDQWKEQVLDMAVPSFKGHAALLHTLGNDKTALQWMEKVKDRKGTSRADFQGLYATLLNNNNHPAAALAVAENAVRNNTATPEVIALVKQAYIKQHGSAAGFTQYFDSMKSTDVLSAQQEHLRAALIREPAPAFKLERLNGGTAELSKQKGSIVVLDFWATWCSPCKEALPGMQMAADKYKADDKVKFYFIATMETKPDYKAQIKQFLAAKNYRLEVLLDGKNKTTGHLDAAYAAYASALHFSGIPAKMIIDKHGVIRWTSNGYMGSPSALADEISYIIELLKKEG
ncbi:TlpA family protein disulfide reductase [Chitinophaga polysaccharea]|uniref:TlpA family protein disulfide reductase n=1 Tax=Chitinophaga TaxID=79328 RepID=UPI0014557815|nr:MULTISPECIES: TlpA disulfide reductase family protein [Chitinophaga]NLR60294.1 TlpA family protein disulfide reductase [Chitinophaga polysaccharea]NLU95942.1 TlpA family protein disulfide reductase [Chitinophaga sp. Ak27]